MTNDRTTPEEMSDSELIEDTKRLVDGQRKLLTQLLRNLRNVQLRKLFSPKYQSLYDFARYELKLSDDQAARRISAMRLLHELPEIEDAISSGALNLTTLGLAQTHFRNERKNKEEQSADASPASEPQLKPGLTRDEKLATLKRIENISTREATRELISLSTCPEKLMTRESNRPVSPTMNELKLLVNDTTLEKIATLKGLLAHKHPYLSNGELFEVTCDVSLNALSPLRNGSENLRRTKPINAKHASEAAKKSPLPKSSVTETGLADSSPEAGPLELSPEAGPAVSSSIPTPKKVSRYIPAQLKRAVWLDAKGACEICGSTHQLEVDHKVPFALGGSQTKENLRLLCRNCNQRLAIETFGIDSVAQKKISHG